ncbi:MAG: hypothetical protein HZA46_18035 [Planctomycetales bacterium]|nr:hypothetical protein [Planctomycetales bacterium]
MSREIEVERTARILKQAEPGHTPPPRPDWTGASPTNPTPLLVVSVVAGVIAFIALLVALFHG